MLACPAVILDRFRIDDRGALVTGAGRGIGELACEFAPRVRVNALAVGAVDGGTEATNWPYV